MRQRRLKAPGEPAVAYYHCLSRVVDRAFVFGPPEREQFVALLREYEAFCGVRVLTYCILSNHFHILLEVPKAPAHPLSSEQLLERLQGLSGTAVTAAKARQMMEMFRQAKDAAGEREFCARLCASMWDVSGFMKLLKQRFTQWFNRQHGRRGTLWEERFKSVLVEGGGEAVAAMAAYIDLNPIRAGLARDPKDYRWCGYAAAVAGHRSARAGLRVVWAAAQRVDPESLGLKASLAGYRQWLFGVGEEREGTTETGAPLRKGFQRADILAVVQARGRLAVSEYLRLRVRYFADGAVLGSKEFVDRVFHGLRHRFGPHRSSGARPLRGVHRPWFALRDLQKNVFG